jgi:transcriptional regulator of acetoin/glycerol metabolism
MRGEIQRLKSLVNELYGMENIVARSPAMQRLLQQVVQVADSDATILLFGETGTGKELGKLGPFFRPVTRFFRQFTLGCLQELFAWIHGLP